MAIIIGEAPFRFRLWGDIAAERIDAGIGLAGEFGDAQQLASREAVSIFQRTVARLIGSGKCGREIHPVFADNLLDQTFLATRPNEIWLADISSIPTDEGWLYLAIVLDPFTRKVVGWAMRDHLHQERAIAALTMAIQRQRPSSDPGRGLIHHSDRGSQYAAGDYRAMLKASGIMPSMSRKGNC